MIATPEQLAAAAKANVDVLLNLANTALASVEQLTALNLNSARNSLDSTASNAKAVMEAKQVSDLAQLQASLAEPRVEQAVAYSRSLYEIATQAQEQLAKVAESQLAEVKQGLDAALAKVAESGPVGSDVAVGVVKSALASANHAYDAMNAAMRQMAELAKANLGAAPQADTPAAEAPAVETPAPEQQAGA